MTYINLQGIGDISDRRLIERLSGWRLWTFLGLFFVNLFALLVLSVFQQQLSPTLENAIGNFLLSQNAILALLIGAFRFPLTVKLAACCASIFGFTWVAVQIFWQYSLSKEAPAGAVFALSLQSIILVMASTIFWWRRTAAPFRFQIRDLLVIVTTIAIVIPSIRSVFYGGVFFELSNLAKQLPFPILNAGWCLLVLCCYVRGVIPDRVPNLFAKQSTVIKHIKINRTLSLVVLAIVLAIGDFTVYRLLNYRSPGTNFLIQRIVYLAWLFLSMVPVIGLEVKPRGLEA